MVKCLSKKSARGKIKESVVGRNMVGWLVGWLMPVKTAKGKKDGWLVASMDRP
jgi:hypothetical protein